MRKVARLFFFLFIIAVIFILGDMRVALEAYAQTETPPTPLETQVEGNNQFAFDLYHMLRDGSENIIYSPYSISAALAMVYAGAREDTANQMADTLHFELSQDELHPAFADLSQLVTSIESEYADSFQLNVANAIWAQDGYPVLADYAALVDAHYGAGLQTLDFANATDEARITINDWVSDQTAGRIPELLAPGSLSPVSRLVLTNAIYFNASWLLLFNEDATEEEAFTLLDGTQIQVPMMHMSNQFTYIEGDNYQIIALAYQPNGEMEMMIVLPESGAFDEVEAGLDGAWFQQVRDDFASWQSVWNVNLSMPRFGANLNADLSQALIEMGMPEAFTTDANFSGIADPATTGEPLFMSFVIHSAVISVDEKGTEAAAATAVGLGGGGPPNEPFDFRVNRPFIYLIYHRQTGTILFMGRVLNPLED